MKEFVSSLAENFKEQFESSPKLSCDILLFLRQPFSVPADGEWTAEAKRLVPSKDEAALQMEVLEMGTSDLLKAQHKESLLCDFWINLVPQARFKNTRAIAMLLLTMFPSTYICESAFSAMNAIKSQDRNRLSNAHFGQCQHFTNSFCFKRAFCYCVTPYRGYFQLLLIIIVIVQKALTFYGACRFKSI